MPDNKINLEIGIDDAQRSLQTLKSEAASLRAELQQIGNTLGTAPSSQGAAQFFQTAQRLSTVESVIASSTSVGMGAAAQAGAMPFQRQVTMRSVADPQGILNVLQNAGVSQQGLSAASLYLANGRIPVASGASFNPEAYVQSVLAASTQAGGGGATVPPWSGGYGGFPGQGGGFYGPGGAPPNYGGASPITGGAGGWVWGQGGFFQGVSNPFNAQMLRGFAYTLGQTGTEVMDLQTQAILTGRADLMGYARAGGSLVGGIGGALIGGLFGGPFGGYLGANVGMQFGGAAGGWMFASEQARLNAVDSMHTFVNTFGVRAGGYSTTARVLRMEDIASNNGPWWLNALHLNPFGVNAEEVTKGYTSVSEALVAGGINPFQRVGNRVYGGERWGAAMEALDQGYGAAMRGGVQGIVGGYAGLGIGMILSQGIGREQLGEAITRRAYTYFRDQGTEVLKGLAPVFGSLTSTGGNIVDILSHFGVTKTLQYERLSNDQFRAEVEYDDLMRVSIGTQSLRRTQRLAATGARGVAARETRLFEDEIGLYDSLPGGRDSLVRAETNARRREALLQSYEEADITGYGIPQAHLSGARARAELLPFSPSNRFALDLRQIELSGRQANVLQQRMESLRKSGDLSEAEELRLTQRIESLHTMEAAGVAGLTEGYENRLPAYAAGRPNFFAWLSSNTLAAMRMNELGLPIRSFGAVNGRQMADQETFARSLYSGDVGPRSRTQAMNADPSVVDLLARILSAIERGGESGKGAFTRRNEEVGSMHAHLSRHDLGEGDLYRNSGN